MSRLTTSFGIIYFSSILVSYEHIIECAILFGLGGATSTDGFFYAEIKYW